MSNGIEEIIIVGRLSKDPELKYTPSGTPALRFSIPTTRKIGSDFHTAWWNVKLFGKGAESLAQLMHKSTLVKANGQFQVKLDTMEPEVFTDKNGVTRSTLTLLARNVELLEDFGYSSEAQKNAEAAQEELPF